MLINAKVDFDFIGNRNQGLQPEVKWPDAKGRAFDPDHEGYYGAKTASVRDELTKIPAPDVAPIHLGTNDQSSEDHPLTVVKPLGEIIELLRGRNPKIRILVGHLKFNGGAALSIRPLVEGMAERLGTADSPVTTVHIYRGWTEDPAKEGTDTFDWAHPNPQGQRKMAEAWFAAMKPALPGN